MSDQAVGQASGTAHLNITAHGLSPMFSGEGQLSLEGVAAETPTGPSTTLDLAGETVFQVRFTPLPDGKDGRKTVMVQLLDERGTALFAAIYDDEVNAVLEVASHMLPADHPEHPEPPPSRLDDEP